MPKLIDQNHVQHAREAILRDAESHLREVMEILDRGASDLTLYGADFVKEYNSLVHEFQRRVPKILGYCVKQDSSTSIKI
ncbi:MAG: hypothetical protein HY366_02150 [Candidatus Aenigmarchaeota archaeon]|nr:hypothetical protein [Candidatus Aenigmarchaeota archaeon]